MKGQTLIEVLVALAIAVLVISAITVTSISSLNSAQYIKDQSQATKYAQEGSEVVRRIRNSNYLGFRSYDDSYCLDAGQTVLGSPALCTTENIIDNKFLRSVQIDKDGCSINISRVTVIVSYTSGKCQSGTFCHTSKLISCLSTVNPVTGP